MTECYNVVWESHYFVHFYDGSFSTYDYMCIYLVYDFAVFLVCNLIRISFEYEVTCAYYLYLICLESILCFLKVIIIYLY